MESEEGPLFRPLSHEDAAALSQTNSFEKYLGDQEAGRRWVLVAQAGAEVAGYVTLLWAADDPVLRDQAVPEISDLSVFPEFRRRGIGSALLDAAEAEAATRSHVVGLNMGLHSGYGPAQRLYARRGYVPDGSGVVIEGVTVPEGATIRLDDQPVVTLRLTKALYLDPQGAVSHLPPHDSLDPQG